MKDMREAFTRVRVLAAVVVAVAMLGSSLAVVSGALAQGGTPASSDSAATPLAGSLTAPPVTPGTPSIDLGQTITLTAAATGGTAPYFYTWRAGTFSTCSGDSVVQTPGGIGQTTSTYTFSPSTSQYVCYSVNDSAVPPNGPVASSVDLVTVNGAFVVNPVSPGSPTIDSGQSIVLSANVTGGTTPYKYQWYTSTTSSCVPNQIGTTQLSGTASTLSVSPSAAAYYCVQANDSAVGSPTQQAVSPADKVAVNPALVPGSPTPASVYGDAGQSFTLSVSGVKNGTLPYSYVWFSGGSATCSGDSTPVPTAQGGHTGAVTVAPGATTYYCYDVSDASNTHQAVASTTAEAVINTTLSAGIISPSGPLLDPGQTVTLTANPSGGALTRPAGYTYAWYSGGFSQCASDTSSAGGNTPAITASASSGTLYYCVEVKDANGTTAWSSSDLVSVEPALLAGLVSPASPLIDTGSSVTLTAAASGGTGPGTYSYQWFETTSSGSCTLGETLLPGATSSTYTFSEISAGTYYFAYRVVDGSVQALSHSACSPVDMLTVNSAPQAAAPTAAPSPGTTIDTGQSETLTASATGGTPVLTYQWRSGSSSSCASDTSIIAGATGTTYAASPTATTFFCYVVSDGSVNPPTVPAAGAVEITVNGVPAAGAVTVTSGVPSIDAGSGENVNLTAHGSGGTPPLSYAWYSGGSATCSADTTPVLPGDHTAFVAVTPSSSLDYCYTVSDAQGKSASTTSGFQVTVNTHLSAAVPTPSLRSLDVGQSFTLSVATITTGTSPYTYQWFYSASPSACTGLSLVPSAVSSTLTVSPPGAGTYNYCYRVTDSSNGTQLQESVLSATPVSVKVYSALAAAPIVCKDNTAGGSCSTPKSSSDAIVLTANATLTGNTSNYAYQWFSGGSSVCSSDTAIAGATGVMYDVATPIPATGVYYCYSVSDTSAPHVTPAFAGETVLSVTYYQTS